MEENFPDEIQGGMVYPQPKKKAHKKIILILALFILLLGVSFFVYKKYFAETGEESAVNPATLADAAAASAGMKKFANYQELMAFMENNEDSFTGSSSKSVNLNQTDRWSEAPTSTGSATAGWGAVGAPSGVPSDVSSNDYSATNIQVAGVDEGDIVKTDGKYIYTVSQQQVLIFSALPGKDAAIVSTIDLGYSPSGIYVSGDKLAVFGNGYDVKPLKDYALLAGSRNSAYSDFRIYDISDRKAPKQEKQYDFEGSYSNSRMIGKYVYFITTTYPNWIYYNEARPIPYIMEDGVISPAAAAPSVYYFDFPYTSQNFTSITAINIEEPQADTENETYVLDGNQNSMYVSTENLYITFSKHISEEELALTVINKLILPRLADKERQRIQEIEGTKNYILNYEEKIEKVYAIYESYYGSLSDEDQEKLTEELKTAMKEEYKSIASEMQKTIIHKISVDDGHLAYKSQGEVPGRVLNQYAMDESAAGEFRIATTVDASWSGLTDPPTKSFNNLYVLDADMKRLGTLEHIAEGESIYSVRFMGERAYMVTFQRTDPLFVIGLRYPDKPVILGELKVPGYSTYLHPYGDNMLIGLGKNADANGRETGGIKLSLFDASDVTSPKEVDNYVFGGYGSSSSALNDPKAFLFSKEKNLLVIPAVVMKSNLTGSYSTSTDAAGSAVFRVDEKGFELRGYIDHRTESQKMSNYYYAGDAKRSLYIDENLYSLSGNYLKVNKLDNLEEVKSLAMSAISSSRGGWGE